MSVGSSQRRGSTLYVRLRRVGLKLSATPFHPQWFSFRGKRKALNKVVAADPKFLLDIGCGDGVLRGRLSTSTVYVGFDYPVTGSAYKARPEVYGDAENLPFAADTFDGVALLDVLEHLPQPEVTLSEIFRTLAPGGRLFVNVPYLYPLHDEPFDYQRPTAYGLASWLKSAGFEIETIAHIGSPGQTVALLFNIALARLILRSTQTFRPLLLLMVIVLPLFLVVNVIGWGLGLFGHDERFMPFAYWSVARRPMSDKAGK